MSEKVDVVIVGAGLAGLAAAYTLAEAGVETIVVERGDYPGSKNVSGGRLYLNPVRPFFPADFWDGAPFERAVVKERLTVVSADAATTVELASRRFRDEPRHSYTVLRAGFDQWLADRVGERGALIVPGYKVDEVVIEAGRVVGVRSADDDLRCDVVIAADGALSFIAEQVGLRRRHDPHQQAVGIKEVIELPARTIEDRFGVGDGEGAAQLFFGAVSQGMFGGGFLYTNRESLSLGMVVGIRALMDRQPRIEAPEVLELFKARPEVASLIAGGNAVEYSAHVVAEGGYRALPRLFGDGILLAGDAAGLALNTGLTVRGMDFALASGALAGRAVLQARERGDFSAGGLAAYEQLLRRSFVLQDLATFADGPAVLDNPRLFGMYPEAINGLLEKLFWIGDGPKPRLSSTVLGEAWRRFGNLDALRDVLGLRKV